MDLQFEVDFPESLARRETAMPKVSEETILAAAGLLGAPAPGVGAEPRPERRRPA